MPEGDIGALAFGHAGAGRHDLKLPHVDHGVHLDKLGVVLQGHKVSRLSRDVQQQGECRTVIQMLHNALGRRHGGIFRRPGAFVIFGFLCPLVAQQEPDVGLVSAHRGDAGIHIHVVLHCDIIVPIGGDGDVALAEDRVEKAIDEGSVIVILGNDQVGGIDPVHPRRHFLVINALAGDRVNQNRSVVVGAAEQADGLLQLGADPVGRPLSSTSKIGLLNI